MTVAFPIIQTKLHRPPLQADFVPRPHLLERLDGWQQRPLTLISAPAGYGKTTLVSSWLDTLDAPSAWVSLDEQDNDLILFLAYFLTAVCSMFQDAAQDTLALVNAPEPPPIQVLTNSLINDLNQITVDFVLVLDDYHSIQDVDIHDLISGLLRYPPPTMQIVLTTRSDPPLNLVKLRAKSTIVELRALDLRFSQAEASDYLRLLLRRPVDEETVVFLSNKSEGWVTGIRLLALSLSRVENMDWTQIDHLENNHMVKDYLMSIILSLQEPAFEECLLYTAVLDRFCAPLCAAICDSNGESGNIVNADLFIRTLVKGNLFVTPLDTQQHWFRYHHLFRDLLLRQLEKREGMAFIASLHHKAGIWYAQNGYIDEALRHALAAGDSDAAVALLAQHRHSLLNQEQWHTLSYWLRLFPGQLVEEEPELLVAKAWILYNRSQYPDMVAVMDQAETLLSRNSSKTVTAKQHQAEIDTMRSEYVLVYEVASKRAVDLAERALSEIPHDWFNVRGLAYVILGYGYLMLGEPEQGFEIIYDVLKTDKSGSSAFRARLLTALCFLHDSNADMPELGQAASQLLKLGEKDDLADSLSYGRYFLGCFHYLRNELVEAERHLVVAASDRKIAQIWSAINSACVLALTYQALDRPDQARDTVEATKTYLTEIQNVEFLPQLGGLGAELALRQEHVDEAGRWARQFDPHPLPLMTVFYVPQLTLAKVLLAQDTSASRKQAGDLLAKLYDHVLNDKRFLIEVLALQALLDDAQNDQAAALDKLERAIHLAEPGGFIRLFVDLGPKMAGLLRQLRYRGVSPSYIKQILDAFPDSVGPEVVLPDTELPEPLTNRELEILALISQGLTNKEIAAQLVIAPGTVTQHTHNIYQKLMVKNRRLAVIEATKLGILPRL
jgi:LuxR family maltose regulon positive regulatory protein